MPAIVVIISLASLFLFYGMLYGRRWLTEAGWRRLRAGDTAGAMNVFKRAAWLSRTADAWLGIAAVHRAAGQREEELAALDRAVAREPSSMEAFDARVEAEVECAGGQRGPAIAWLSARAADSRLGRVPRMMARAQRGIWTCDQPALREAAISDLEEAWRVVPDPLVGLHLGRALLAAGQQARAVPVLEQVAAAAEKDAAFAVLELMELGGELGARWRAEAAKLEGASREGRLVLTIARARGGDAEALAVLRQAVKPEHLEGEGTLRRVLAELLGEKADVVG